MKDPRIYADLLPACARAARIWASSANVAGVENRVQL